MHFLLFSKKSLKIFSKIPQRIMFFVKTRENLTQGFEIILKIDQNNAFFVLFQINPWKFSKEFATQLDFSSKARKFNAGFFNFFEKSPQIIHFLKFSWEIFWEFSKFSGVRGAPPPDPLRWRPPKMSPPEPKSWRRRWLGCWGVEN